MRRRMAKPPPHRVFLDTNVVNMILDYGEMIHDCVEVPADFKGRLHSDIEALRGIFFTGQRAFWELAVSPLTYREVIRTKDATHQQRLTSWFFEIWEYWREFLHSASDLPSFSEAEEERLGLISSGILEVLPDLNDRVLICDAVVYRCDAFCTRDWSTVLRHREQLGGLSLRIVTPTEWWELIRSWGEFW